MKRPAFDYLGNQVGELELPDNTQEDIWEKKLAEIAKAPEVIIPDVTPRQFRQALVLNGISIATIENLINSQPEPTKSLAWIEWEYSTAFKRNNPLVNQLAPLIGFNSEMLDNLWLTAGTL